MIKVSVFYPADGGEKFDHAYYREKHLPMIQQRLGAACLGYEIDKGLAGGAPGSPPPFVAMCHIFSDSLESFQAAFAPHAAEIMGDVAHYTDITPILQFNEVIER
ncbi:EthD family reductase [Novosphingobium terrae]|uniref:EthD family reductase n=1 Tax=Novosphingobium terrae TaxID=2726189 RepID=UPI001980ED43|nr:EthD family reductase [Novosphingobium terrae]